ncbi:MAG: hypothetical protein M1444_03060 [Patescibacteria group bacterium]|nr:hypothetical protein [Patescibacteria group bacterium]
MKKWFVTWDRPEYKEWATPISKGYLLVVLRREKTKFLCVKAELIMGEKGLPAFNVLEEKYYPTKPKASKQIREWRE